MYRISHRKAEICDHSGYIGIITERRRSPASFFNTIMFFGVQVVRPQVWRRNGKDGGHGVNQLRREVHKYRFLGGDYNVAVLFCYRIAASVDGNIDISIKMGR